MIGKKNKNSLAAADTPEDKIILSAVPNEGIFFENLLNKVSEKLEKLKVKKSLIENRILGLINKGRIYWKGVKLFRKNPPTTHPPSFFYKKWLI